MLLTEILKIALPCLALPCLALPCLALPNDFFFREHVWVCKRMEEMGCSRRVESQNVNVYVMKSTLLLRL
jgi:hypothetical protein